MRVVAGPPGGDVPRRFPTRSLVEGSPVRSRCAGVLLGAFVGLLVTSAKADAQPPAATYSVSGGSPAFSVTPPRRQKDPVQVTYTSCIAGAATLTFDVETNANRTTPARYGVSSEAGQSPQATFAPSSVSLVRRQRQLFRVQLDFSLAPTGSPTRFRVALFPDDEQAFPPPKNPGILVTVPCVSASGGGGPSGPPEGPGGGGPPGGPGGGPPGGGEQLFPGVAALRIPRGCVQRAFTARVSGSRIKSVEFSLDRRRIKIDTTPPFSARIDPRALRAGVHHLTARVLFERETTPARTTLRLALRRCPVRPRFTG